MSEEPGNITVQVPAISSQPETKVQRPTKPIASIKGGRKKAGEQYYCVVYEGQSSDKGHWFREVDLDCKDLIQAYEQSRIMAKVEAKEAKKKQAEVDGVPATKNKKVVEIYGFVAERPDSFLVKFSGSAKPEIVSKSFLYSHAAKLLLTFYENHIQWLDAPESEKKKKAKNEVKTEEQAPEAEKAVE